MSSVNADLIYRNPGKRLSVENVDYVNKCAYLCQIMLMK